MEHQDYNTIVFTQKNNTTNKSNNKQISQKQNNDNVIIEPAKNLGLIISQSRMLKNKNQKQLSQDLGISSVILSKWESGKEIPNNNQIAQIEKVLNIKLPRNKKKTVID